MPACVLCSVGNLSLPLSLSIQYTTLTQTFQSGLFFSQSTMETCKLFKIRIKLVLEKIQLNFL